MKKFTRAILLFMYITVNNNAEEIQLLKDRYFNNSFTTQQTDLSHRYDSDFVTGILQKIGATTAPSWTLGEWWSKSSLCDLGCTAEPSNFWATEHKAIRIEGNVITFAVNGQTEYNNSYHDEIYYANNGWASLIIAQVIDENKWNYSVSTMNSLQLTFDAYMDYYYRPSDAIGATSDSPKSSQFILNLTMQDKNFPHSFIWLQVPIFDNRRAVDEHTSGEGNHNGSEGQQIYYTGNKSNIPALSKNGKRWKSYNIDMKDYIVRAFNLLVLTDKLKDASKNLADYYISTFNVGWELKSPDIATIKMRDISLVADINSGISGVSNITNYSAKLFWNDSFNNENGFGIYRNGQLIDTVGANVTSYTLDNLNNNTDYTYVVKAYTNNNVSDIATINFQTTNTVPDAPSSMRVLYVTSHSATLKWNDNSNNEAGFKIYRGNTLISTVGANTTRYELDNLSSNTTYTYKVKSYSADLSSNTDYVTFKTMDVIPNAPQNFKASIIKTKSITLSWSDKSNNELGFRIYQDGEWIANINAGSTKYTVNNLEPRKSYHYTIKSYNDIGKSNAVNITVQTNDDYVWLIPVYYMLLD